VRVSGQIMLLVDTASLFAWLLTIEKIPQALSAAIHHLSSGPLLFVLLANQLLP
jgi:TRAP-type C4-dicarboxylate transport system permease large subunit